MITLAPARYTKNKVAATCRSDGSGMKTRGQRLATALGGRWSRREKAYIMSEQAAAKLKRLYDAGYDAEPGCRAGKLDWIVAERAEPC